MPEQAETRESTIENPTLIVMKSREGDGLGLTFKVAENGRIFRLASARDPRQPRFWCFRIDRCSSMGVVSNEEQPWWGAGGMTRAELPDAVQTIRTDPDAWIASHALDDLRDWILGEPEGSDSLA